MLSLRETGRERAPLDAFESSCLVDDAAVSAFERDGVVCLRQVLDRAGIDLLSGAIDQLASHIGASAAGYDITEVRRRLYAGDSSAATGPSNGRQYDRAAVLRAFGARTLSPLIDSNASGEGHFMLDSSTWRRNRVVRHLALDSRLPEIAAGLLRAHKVNYCDDQIFVKSAGTAECTAFHQDYSYFRMSGWQGCTMWICVDHADENSGSLAYVRGSHRWGRQFAPNFFFAHVEIPGSSGESLEEVEAHPENYELLRFEVEPGDIVVHHFRTVHGARGNCSNHPRRALSLRYGGEDMHYHRRPGTPDQPYQHHALREGDPLDSEVFPVVWPKPFPGFSLADAYYDRLELAA
jgi:ectoine hydroxylase-related dioxygenase (phytanoyl-CoA dioxygenase family)